MRNANCYYFTFFFPTNNKRKIMLLNTNCATTPFEEQYGIQNEIKYLNKRKLKKFYINCKISEIKEKEKKD